MSLSPFDSFQSRFVTYLLNRRRKKSNLLQVFRQEQNKKLDCTMWAAYTYYNPAFFFNRWSAKNERIVLRRTRSLFF